MKGKILNLMNIENNLDNFLCEKKKQYKIQEIEKEEIKYF